MVPSIRGVVAEANHNSHLNSLDSLRGVAALATLLFHLVTFAQLKAPSELNFIALYFGQGVPLFFCLSGFVLAYGYSDKFANDSQIILKFYLKRFFRIAPLFYFTLIIWRSVGHVLWSWVDSFDILFLNFTFLFGLVPTAFESLVMAGWSIGVEMLFYLMFPILIILMGTIKKGLYIFVLSLIMSSIFLKSYEANQMSSYGYMNAITQIPFFIAGILTFRIWQVRKYEKSSHPWILWGCFLLLIITLVNSKNWFFAIFSESIFGLHRNLWAVIFSMLIYSLHYKSTFFY
jgi:peptidoglycan/LPS O-acetylase OafA/YrhL